VLGLPPSWYKDPAYRSRVVREPRQVLAEFGLDLEPGVQVRVFDSSSEVRYMVLPQRPPGTGDLSEDELAALVTRDSMVGVAKVSGETR
jgi:nitrile hydratase